MSALEESANSNPAARPALLTRGRLLSAYLEIGADLDTPSADPDTLVVRRLRLFDSESAGLRELPGGSTTLMVQIYSELVPAADAQIDAVIALGELARFPAVKMPALAMMHQLAMSLIDGSRRAFEIEPAWARTLGRMAQDLTGVVPSAEVVSAARLAQISRVVERFSSDPLLTPESLAETVQISRRTLYDLTKPMVGGISEFIRVTRATRAMRMLMDPACDRLTVAEIARRTGFSSPKHLRRALSSKYEVTPEAARSSRDLAA
jgi:AraC-like DNA-binding protein